MNKDNTPDIPSELKPQVKKKIKSLRRKTNKQKPKLLVISLDIIVKICMECVRWEDAKPHVDLLEKIYGINPPPIVYAAINKIKRKFGLGKSIQTIKAEKVVMNHNRFEAMNKITRNKHVKL